MIRTSIVNATTTLMMLQRRPIGGLVVTTNFWQWLPCFTRAKGLLIGLSTLRFGNIEAKKH